MSVAHRVALVLAMTSVACIDPARVNTDCAWKEPDSRPLDLSTRTDRAHLREDARVAGEVEVRYADARRKVPSEMTQYVNECRSKLVAVITAAHHISAADLERARHARNWPVDIALIFVPMALVAMAAVSFTVRRVCSLFDQSGRRVAAISVGLLVPLLSALAVGVTQTWEFGVTSWLLRDGHVSFRAFYNPATMHGWITFFGALIVCGATAYWQFQRAPMGRLSAAGHFRVGQRGSISRPRGRESLASR